VHVCRSWLSLLTNPQHVRTETNVRSNRDARRKVNRHIFAYYDHAERDGHGLPAEYRVAFESSRQVTNIRTSVPQQGTSTLDVLRQWNERTGRTSAT
jgi:hypothetical protein